MKGNTTKGTAWANSVRATLYASPQTSNKPAWKFSFQDHIRTDNKKRFVLAGDYALAFGLMDNRQLGKLIDLDSLPDLSTREKFYVHSSSRKQIEAIAGQLDQALLEQSGFPIIPQRGSKLSFFQKIQSAIVLFRILRTSNPHKKMEWARKILTDPKTVAPVTLTVWEEIAETFFITGAAVHLAEPIFRKAHLVSKDKGLRKHAVYTAQRIADCFFAKQQWPEALNLLEQTVEQGFDSAQLQDMMVLCRIKLEEEGNSK